MKWWQYGISRGLYNLISKGVDANASERVKAERVQKIQAEYDERHKKDEIILARRRQKFQDKINIVDNYLNNIVNIKLIFENAIDTIDKWFDLNHWQKTSYERRSSCPNYAKIKLTVEQRDELKELLSIQPDDYVQQNPFYSEKSEDSTLVYLIENSSVAEELRRFLTHRNYSLYIDTHYDSIIGGATTICFGLTLIDGNKY